MAANTAASGSWFETPLIRSGHISNILGCSAYLKLENLQPSQSFKYRGISFFAQHCKEKYGPSVHLIIASGGNAGLAAACAANVLNLRCTVYIPEGVSQRTLYFLRKERAEVVIGGHCYLQALQRAEAAVGQADDAVMVPAYDDPVLWQGHSSMIKEMAAELRSKPDAIFCSVGGGGLLGGIIVGCKEVGWDDVPIVALETNGSDCFYHSISMNRGKFEGGNGIQVIHDEKHNVDVAYLERLQSRASGSLGASSPSPGVVKMALERKGGIICASVPDEWSMEALELFAEDHKFLVELACSTTLTPAYHKEFFTSLMSKKHSGEPGSVVFVVCGGFKISLDEIEEYRKILHAHAQLGTSNWEMLCDGERWIFGKVNDRNTDALE